jgi:hypothetical protein
VGLPLFCEALMEYETDDDRVAQRKIMARMMLQLPSHYRAMEMPRLAVIDFMIIGQTTDLHRLVEIKDRDIVYGQFSEGLWLSHSKAVKIVAMSEWLKVPYSLAVQLKGGAVYSTHFLDVKSWPVKDRAATGRKEEPVMMIPWEAMRLLLPTPSGLEAAEPQDVVA